MKDFIKRQQKVILGVCSFVLAIYSGIDFLIPAVGTMISWSIFSKKFPESKQPLRYTFSVQTGYCFWIFFAALIPSNIIPVITEICLVIVGLISFYRKPSLWSAAYLSIIHAAGFTIVVNKIVSIPFGTAGHKAYLVHFVFRMVSYITLILAYKHVKKKVPTSTITKKHRRRA